MKNLSPQVISAKNGSHILYSFIRNSSRHLNKIPITQKCKKIDKTILALEDCTEEWNQAFNLSEINIKIVNAYKL